MPRLPNRGTARATAHYQDANHAYRHTAPHQANNEPYVRRNAETSATGPKAVRKHPARDLPKRHLPPAASAEDRSDPELHDGSAFSWQRPETESVFSLPVCPE